MDKIYGVFAIFNKTDLGKEKVTKLQHQYASEPDIHIVYATGKVNFTGKNPDIFNVGFHIAIDQIS